MQMPTETKMYAMNIENCRTETQRPISSREREREKERERERESLGIALFNELLLRFLCVSSIIVKKRSTIWFN